MELIDIFLFSFVPLILIPYLAGLFFYLNGNEKAAIVSFLTGLFFLIIITIIASLGAINDF